MAKKRKTQAVILIHGIGEQRPMDTLRSFVDAVLPEPESGQKYFSKPDTLSDILELRKLQDRDQPRTHFFEYYWAYKVEGTTFSHVFDWLKSLLLRRPMKIPPHLLPLYFVTWLLVLSTIFFFGLGFADWIMDTAQRLPSFYVSIASFVLLSAVQYIVLKYIGDAARYLSPNPRNIALRREIRSDGLKLLRAIHKSIDPVYDRVCIVGHSLGSIIGYDILRQFWTECNELYTNPHNCEQKALEAVETIGGSLTAVNNSETLATWQSAQIDLWAELQGLGCPWKVTDFITIGSPLAHAAMLMAIDETDLKLRQEQRELPTNPPVPEHTKKGKLKYSYVWDPDEVDGKKIRLARLHHAALFACTRWTNLFYPVTCGFFGDIIGGPLQRWFGKGIRDISVGFQGVISKTPISHVMYWNPKKRKPKKGNNALDTLILALDRDGDEIFQALEKVEAVRDNPLPDSE